jgi:nucleoside-diphosphate-sugar epimerase
MIALITGGAGCLGATIARRLRERGEQVRILDTRPLDESDDESIAGDVCDLETLCRAARGASVIFNLAALQPVSRAGGEFRRINVGGTTNVLEAAKRERCEHVVHVSSSIVYGIPMGRPFREDDPLNPIGAYGLSKVAAEEACASSRVEGRTVSVIRPRVIMGPGRLGLFSILFRWVREGRRIYLIGSGENQFQMAASEDVASACILAADARANDTFNVGSDDVPRVRDLLDRLVRHAGSPSRLVPLPAAIARLSLRALDRFALAPLTAEHYLFADKTFVLDTTRAKERLGWTPRATDGDALCSAYDDFIVNQAPKSEFRHDRPHAGVLDLLRRVS